MTDAPDLPLGEGRRANRAPVIARAAEQVGAIESLDEVAERPRLGGFGGREEGGDRSLTHRPARRARRATAATIRPAR
jgi:hypothetical protein